MSLLRTPLYQVHVEAGAKLVPFAGFEMPVSYEGVIDEHRAVRSAVGIFDVSHMGEVELVGPRALEVANRIITNDLERIADGRALYTVMCKEDGGIVDDLIVYRVARDRVFICVNASNRAKDFAWMERCAAGDCEVRDVSDEWALIAVQGPRAVELTARVSENPELTNLPSFAFVRGRLFGTEAMFSRTGYTGEDGFEIYVRPSGAERVWRALLERGRELGVKPAGLGARDSLRLEMKLALYGNDIDESTNPYEAALGWVVKLDKPAFVAKSALEEIRAEGPKRKLIGFELIDRGIARHDYPVVSQGGGVVTSGTMGPSVGKAIGMAYVTTEKSAIGSEIEIDIRGRAAKARVVKTPFYRRP